MFFKKKIILATFSVVMTLALCEVIVRTFSLTDHFMRKGVKWNHWRGDKELAEWYTELYKYNPDIGYERTEVYNEIKRILRYNSESFKILVLGDSVTQWGNYVDYLEDLIVTTYLYENIELVNAGVMGYDMNLAYKYLRYRGIDLDPNLVIIQFNPNDFFSTPFIVQDGDSWFAYDRKKIHKFVSPFLFSRSHLYRMGVVGLMAYSNRDRRRKQFVKQPLSKMKTFLENHNIPYFILYFPYLSDTVPKGIEKFDQYFFEITDKCDIRDRLIELLKEHPAESREDISSDPYHLNDKGDRIAADVLFKRLKPFLYKQFKMPRNGTRQLH